MKSKFYRFLVVPVVSLAFGGCAADEADEAAGIDSAIVDGKVSTENGDGVVMVNSSFTGCTGTLIADSVVMTAAHCVVKPEPANTVAGGSIVSGTTKNGTGWQRTVSAFDTLVAPGYDAVVQSKSDSEIPSGWQADVAILILNTRAPEDVSRVPLAPRGSDALYAPGTRVKITGYGFTKTGGKDYGVKRSGESTVFQKYDRFVATKKLSAGDASVCQGDSGGPLRLATGGAVIGITSFVTAPKGVPQCESRAMFVRVDAFRDFIDYGVFRAANVGYLNGVGKLF